MGSSRRTRARSVAAATAATVLLLTVATQATASIQPAGTPVPASRAAGEVPVATPTTTDRIIVKYRTGLSASPSTTQGSTVEGDRRSRIEDAFAGLGPDVTYVRDTALGAQVWELGAELPVAEVAAATAAIAQSDPTIEYAEPDRVLHALAAAPNDPSWSSLWALQTSSVGINVLQAWDVTRGSGVNVAVIDTGYRPHADLAANIVGGYDMITDTAVSNDGNGRDTDASDPGDYTAANECAAGDPAYTSSWHGTHVAGTIAAVANNGAGVAGIAPAAKVVPLRVLGTCGGYTSDIADAMIWASGGTVSGVPANTNRAKVLNLSLGGSGACDTTSQNAITAARANGAVVVVAAGNSNTNVSTSSPANCSGVIAVAAYGPTGARATYSNYGTLVDIAAPGGQMSAGTTSGILSTMNAGTSAPGADSYAYYQGTSMATPHVAGVAALMFAANSALSPDQVESLLKSSSRAFVATCSGCGAGMLDASAAVAAATGGTTPTPTPTTPVPTTGTETEPNNTRATATVATAPVTFSGAIGSTSDTDYFTLTLPAGKSLSATLTALASTADYDLYLYNASGAQVASSTLGAGSADTASVTNTGTAAAAFYARVVRYSGGTGATNGRYTLGLTW